MRKLTITFFLTLFLAFSLVANENFSEMSTQELISIMGYVKKADAKKFQAELQSRIPKMSKAEKKSYEANLEKINK